MLVLCTLRIALLLVVGATVALGEERDEAARFRPVDVYVDAGDRPLAAYQIEITAADCAEVVGVEGGDHAAFRAAPYYDPAALSGGRIVIGAFSTAADLPRGKTRVAKLHMRETRSPCSYAARLVAAASDDGARAPAKVLLEVLNGGSHE